MIPSIQNLVLRARALLEKEEGKERKGKEKKEREKRKIVAFDRHLMLYVGRGKALANIDEKKSKPSLRGSIILCRKLGRQ